MRMIDTITNDDISSGLSGNPIGFFKYLNLTVKNGGAYSLFNFSNASLEYYLSHSGLKTASHFVENLFTKYREGQQDPNQIIALTVMNKFNVNWSRIYNELIAREYDASKNDDFVTTEIGNSNEDNKLSRRNVDERNSNSNTVTSSKTDTDDSVYGFNSTSPSPSDKSVTDIVDSENSDSRKNTSYSSQNGTENDVRKRDSKNTISSAGIHDTTYAETLQKEIDFRIYNNFIDIVFRDIDSILTLKIYE